MESSETNRSISAGGALRAVGLAVLAAVLLLLLWKAAAVFVLAFAGVLLGVLLRAPADWLASHTRVPGSVALALVIVVLLGLVALGAWLLAPRAAAQFEELARQLPESLRHLRDSLQQYSWGQWIIHEVGSARRSLPGAGNVLGKVTGVASTMLGALANVVIVLVIGIYLAIEPRLYERGLLHLVPFARRARAREVLRAVERTLAYWVLGRLTSMVAVGVVTALGLWLLGVPLAFSLGLINGLLDFVPNIGPIVAAVPALLLAGTLGAMKLLYVALLYLGVNLLDGYVLTPLIQRRAVQLPPALLLAAQVLLGMLLGVLGVLVATPLAAVALVLVKMLYVQDHLGDPIDVKTAPGGA